MHNILKSDIQAPPNMCASDVGSLRRSQSAGITGIGRGFNNAH